jgi:hypothetical protein
MANTNVLIFGVVLLGGLIFLGLAINQYLKAKKAEKSWLTATGVVLNSGVNVHQSRNSKGQTTRSYIPKVNYQYQVKDQTYNGERLGFGSGSFGESKANKKIALYPQGAQVTVHYDPADPSKAVLETKATDFVKYLVFGIILTVLGIVLLFLLLK